MESDAISEFVRASAAQVRFSGLLLSIMVERGLLTNEQASGLIQNVKASFPGESQFQRLYDELLLEFR